jgi:hypothetical protein
MESLNSEPTRDEVSRQRTEEQTEHEADRMGDVLPLLPGHSTGTLFFRVPGAQTH